MRAISSQSKIGILDEEQNVPRLLAYVTGSVNQELLLQNEYLTAENRILRAKLPRKLPWRILSAPPSPQSGSDWGVKYSQRGVACVATPDTILAWYWKYVANKFDRSKRRQYPGRPTVPPEAEALVVKMARENTS
jgi:putative transposase